MASETAIGSSSMKRAVVRRGQRALLNGPPAVPALAHQTLRTFDVVNRFTKTRRFLRALAVTHPPVRHAYMAPPASIRLGAQTALVRCQVAQGPHPRVSFFARGGGGGVGMVLTPKGLSGTRYIVVYAIFLELSYTTIYRGIRRTRAM